METIKFRAKTDDERNEWVYGVPFKNRMICGEELQYYDDDVSSSEHYEYDDPEVKPESIGQFTGLTDNNGKEIFEGDIVNCWGGEYCQGYWEYNTTIKVLSLADIMQLTESENAEVIGNITDNPKLLESEA